jgi:hypothetical protein
MHVEFILNNTNCVVLDICKHIKSSVQLCLTSVCFISATLWCIAYEYQPIHILCTYYISYLIYITVKYIVYFTSKMINYRTPNNLTKGKSKLIGIWTDKISQQPENCENRNDPDLEQAFLKKWWVEFLNVYKDSMHLKDAL